MAESASVDDHAVKLPRPPNRKKFEDEIEVCLSIIRTKESDLKALSVRSDDKILSELETLRSEKGTRIQRRQAINVELSKVNQDIGRQEAELARLQASLQYRNEAKINEAIIRLQTQLSRRNFSLNEERKIVSEIDNLKRSKKDLGVYLTAKKLLDEKRDKARQLRDDRDKVFKEVTEMNRKEEHLRHELQHGREQTETIQSEISEQRLKVRTLKFELSEQEKKFEESKRRHTAQQQRAKKDERKAAEHAYKQQLAELKATCDPHAERKLLCVTLLNYLQRFNNMNSSGSVDDDVDDSSVSTSCSRDLERSLEAEGMYLLRKKSDDDEQQQSRLKTGRKTKKDKKKFSLRRNIVHTPEIFKQFSALELTAPLTQNDVPDAVTKLTTLQKHYTTLSEHHQLAVAAAAAAAAAAGTCDMPFMSCQCLPSVTLPTAGMAAAVSDTNATPSSAASYTGSVPSTPDTQHDTPPRLTPHVATLDCCCTVQTARRLSHDSGACCELDELSASLSDCVDIASVHLNCMLGASLDEYRDLDTSLKACVDIAGCGDLGTSLAACGDLSSSLVEVQGISLADCSECVVPQCVSTPSSDSSTDTLSEFHNNINVGFSLS